MQDPQRTASGKSSSSATAWPMATPTLSKKSASIFCVTRERVRQIEAKAVRKLQHPVRSRQLEGFLDLWGAMKKGNPAGAGG